MILGYSRLLAKYSPTPRKIIIVRIGTYSGIDKPRHNFTILVKVLRSHDIKIKYVYPMNLFLTYWMATCNPKGPIDLSSWLDSRVRSAPSPPPPAASVMVVTVMAVIMEAAVMMMETSVMVMAADVTTSVRHRGNLDPNSSRSLLSAAGYTGSYQTR